MLRFYLSCALGMEKALGQELKHGGFSSLASGPGFQETEGGLREALYLLRSLRSAERIFIILADFEALDFDQLYDGVAGIPWEDYLHKDQGLTIEKVRIHKSKINSIPHTQAVVQKAAFSRLCKAFSIRSVPLDGYCHQVRALIHNDRARIILDLSGEALHMRQWRRRAGPAPLKETVASGMLLTAAWKRKYPLWDGFCGSGTLPIEALSFAFGLPVHPSRKFGLHRLKIHENRLDQLVKDELLSDVAWDSRVRIHASDKDGNMVDLAKENFARFLELHELDEDHSGILRKALSFSTADALQVRRLEGFDPQAREEPGLMVCNPPYAERMGEEAEVKALYHAMSGMRHHFPSWALSVITTWDNLDHLMETRASWVKPVKNGQSEAWLYLFPAKDEGKDITKDKSGKVRKQN